MYKYFQEKRYNEDEKLYIHKMGLSTTSTLESLKYLMERNLVEKEKHKNKIIPYILTPLGLMMGEKLCSLVENLSPANVSRVQQKRFKPNRSVTMELRQGVFGENTIKKEGVKAIPPYYEDLLHKKPEEKLTKPVEQVDIRKVNENQVINIASEYFPKVVEDMKNKPLVDIVQETPKVEVKKEEKKYYKFDPDNPYWFVRFVSS